MNSNQILNRKTAVVFGPGGSIGEAVAKEFAAEGAEVFLSGRTKSSVDGVVKEIVAKGGRTHGAAVDTADDIGSDRARMNGRKVQRGWDFPRVRVLAILP